MIKVLINVPNSKSWVGGLNYFVNLAEAVKSLKHSKIELVVLCHDNNLPHPLNSLARITTGAVNPKANLASRVVRRLKRILLRQDILVKSLTEQDIKLFSHGFYLGKAAPIPTLAWIPDFQHKYLPHFFSATECAKRDIAYKSLVKNKQPIVFSSETALQDFNKFYPRHNCPTYVLRFVSKPGLTPSDEIMEQVLKKYQIEEPFFHVPNQLWAHKNHNVIVEALSILNKSGKCPLVISTGFTEDYRNPDYFRKLQEKVKNYGLSERFRFLGLIEYESMASLMRKSIALINPSLFEGWSTTVEEAKSLGKSIILSDIPVHKEQSPERGHYFDPYDSAQLAIAMSEVIAKYEPNADFLENKKAEEGFPERFKQFGQVYESIVLDVIHNQKS